MHARWQMVISISVCHHIKTTKVSLYFIFKIWLEWNMITHLVFTDLKNIENCRFYDIRRTGYQKGKFKKGETGCYTMPETLSHSAIVETCLLSYSEFVDGHPGWCKGDTRGNYGIYHQYSNGAINPAFTGILQCVCPCFILFNK